MLVYSYDRSSQRIVCPHRQIAVPPANVSLAIYDDGGTSLVSWTAATKGTFATSLSVAAAAGDTSITLEALTGLTIDEPVILTAGSETELVQVQRFTGSTATLRDPLARSYPVGSSAKSALIYYDADFSDEDTYPIGTYYQAAFRSTAWTEVVAQVFRIVDWKTTNPITYDKMRQVLRHQAAIRDGHDKPNLDAPRDLAWDMIKLRISSDGRDPDVMRDTKEVALAGAFLAAALYVMGKANGLEKAEALAGDPIGSGGIYESQYQLLTKLPIWFDKDQDHNIDSGEIQTPASNRMGRGL